MIGKAGEGQDGAEQGQQVMIHTERLTKIYASGVKALDNLSIQVEEGEIFGFLGPNGAGKSTTIKILTTLSRPTSGAAWIGGHNVLTEPDDVRRSIGYVAQETGVDYFLSGRENLFLQGRMYRMERKTISSRVEELLELFDLKESADALVSTYSGGMKRKLDIATALIHNPKILFLDEPTLGLDPHSRSSLWNYIRMLNKDMKVTIFLTTHYLDEADKLSHRIGILHKGSMKIVDTPDALKDSIKGDSVNLSINDGVKEKAIPILKASSMVKDLLCENGHVRVYVNNGSEAIPGLMKLLGQHGIEISSVTVSRPSLDDVYLKYSGVSFKEGESGEGGEPWWAKWQKGGWGKWKGGGDWNQEESGEMKEGETDWQKWQQKKDECKDTPSTSPDWVQEDCQEDCQEDWKKWQPAGSGTNGNTEDISVKSEEKPEERWDKWQNKAEDEKQEESWENNSNKEEAWKKWGSSSDWEKWGKGGDRG